MSSANMYGSTSLYIAPNYILEHQNNPLTTLPHAYPHAGPLIESPPESEEEGSPRDERGISFTVVLETPPGTPPDATLLVCTADGDHKNSSHYEGPTQIVSTEGYILLNSNPYVYNYPTKTKELVQLSFC